MAAMRVQNILRAQGRALNLPLGAPCLEISLPGVTSSSCAAPLSWQGGSKRRPPPRHCQALLDSRKRGFYSLVRWANACLLRAGALLATGGALLSALPLGPRSS